MKRKYFDIGSLYYVGDSVKNGDKVFRCETRDCGTGLVFRLELLDVKSPKILHETSTVILANALMRLTETGIGEEVSLGFYGVVKSSSLVDLKKMCG